MRIVKILSQERRDFQALYECEHCGHRAEWSGYDDENFHQNVIPNEFKCPGCCKLSPSDYRGLSTKYPEGMEV